MTWLAACAAGDTDVDRTFGLLPEAYARFRELYRALWEPEILPRGTLELCRRRVAMLLGAASDDPLAGPGDDILTDAQLAALPRYGTSSLFSSEQRACLAYAEQYVLDPHGFTDEDFASLHALLDGPRIATLTLAVAVFDALSRLRLALGQASGGPS